MPLSNRFISRAKLIQGALATGALVACRGGNTSTLAGGMLPAGSPMATSPVDRLALIDEIFAHDVFKHVDKQRLVDRFDPTPHRQALQQVYLTPRGRRIEPDAVIKSIPSDGIVINAPGTYVLGADIKWTPSAGATAAITILSGSVTLDMRGHSLTGSIVDKSRQIAGIAASGVVKPLTNVTIKNGTIASFTEYGIMAQKISNLKITGITVSGICMKNLSIRLLTPCGIFVGNSENVSISKCRVVDTSVTTDSSAGIQLIQSTQGLVSQCVVSSLVNNDGAAQGFSPISCTNIVHLGCKAESLKSHFNGNVKSNGHTVIGFCPIFCKDLTFTDCSSTDLTGCCDDCHGMSVFLDAQVTVTRFRTSNVLDGAGPEKTGAKATGLEVYGVGVTCVDCVADNVRAINPQDLQAAGFSAWGALLEFSGCSASNVSVKNDIGGARGVGFGWAPDPRPELVSVGAVNVLYSNCKADKCDVAFDTWYHVNSAWIGTTYKNCKVGYLVQPGAKRTLTCDGCSECDPSLSVTITNIASGNILPP